MTDRPTSASDARRAAVTLLDKVLGDGLLLAECQAQVLERLEPADRARAQRLALEVLRSLERADRVLAKHLRKSPALHVKNALRLGTVELCSGGAAHGVVNDIVNLVARHRRHAQLKGLVNAVLRKVATDGPTEWVKLRVPRLPKWLRSPLAQAWGSDAMLAIEATHLKGAPLDLSFKPGADLSALGGKPTPTGSLRLDDAGQVSALPGCKTLQMAAAGADVTAVDISESRLARLQENLTRTGLSAHVIAGDVLAQKGQYDAVLLDAPCSATGTIRRHPDLPHAKDGAGFGALIELQAQMLAHAWTLVRPGGRLVYCTCSLLPDEGECQIEDALEMFPEARIGDRIQALEGIDPAWITEEGGLRLRPDYWPEIGGMDGFYMAELVKAEH